MQLIKLTIFFLFLQSCLDANIKKKPSDLKNDKANVSISSKISNGITINN